MKKTVAADSVNEKGAIGDGLLQPFRTKDGANGGW
jgi:hypothetical protein